jgi:hypothetical protein
MVPDWPIQTQFIIAQILLCETGYLLIPVKYFLEWAGAGRDRHGAETQSLDEV